MLKHFEHSRVRCHKPLFQYYIWSYTKYEL